MAVSSTSYKPGTSGSPATTFAVAEGHPRWTGDECSYRAAHYRAQKALKGQPCSHCGTTVRVEVALMTGTGTLLDETRQAWYSPDPTNYIPLCISCHRKYDGWYARVRAKRA